MKICVLGGDSRQQADTRRLLAFIGEEVAGPDTAHAAICLDSTTGAADQSTFAGVRVQASDLAGTAGSEGCCPWTLAQLQQAVARCYQMFRGQAEDDAQQCAPELVGDSEPMRKLRSQLWQLRGSDVAVLITGESGTGKELVARAIHRLSERRAGPFVPINCGAIPAELLETELFGHERGAFTGAVSRKPGRFELARGGTLFLDEIGDMPFPMQVKLLRVLQDQRFERVGGRESIEVDVRVVAATNQDLEGMIDTGGFRPDLYYRLNVFPLAMPALREHMADLPALIDHHLDALAAQQVDVVRLSAEAMATLARYPWPGNVRELRNLLERLSIQYPGELVSTDDLPEKFRQPEPRALPVQGVATELPQARLPLNGLDLKAYLAELETSLIQQALDDSGAVVARAADRLHIRRTTLVEKMRKYGIGRSGL